MISVAISSPDSIERRNIDSQWQKSVGTAKLNESLTSFSTPQEG